MFHDVTAGASCVPGTQGYDCRPGYDLATGLGSVDARALVQAWSGATGNNVEAVIRQPGADLTVAAGTAVAFRGTALDSDPEAILDCGWDLGDGGAARGPACAHVFRNPGAAPLAQRVTFTARDGTGAQGSDTRTVTVLPPPAPGELIVNGGFELGALGWTGRGVVIGDGGPRAPAHQGTAEAWFPEGGVLQQAVAIPAGAGSARLTFWLHASGPALGAFQFKVRGADGRLRILAAGSGLDAGPGYRQHAVDLGAYRGQTVRLSFVAADREGTAFALDDVSLIAGP